MNRRELLKTAGLATAGVMVGSKASAAAKNSKLFRASGVGTSSSWDDIRNEFDLDPEFNHLAGFLLATHPRVVREAIHQHEKSFDRNPVHYLEREVVAREEAVREAAAQYFGGDKSQYGLTSSTTMGAALVYNGVQIRPDQEVLYSIHDHFTSRNCITSRAKRNGFSEKKIVLYENPFEVTKQQILERIQANITSKTRVLVTTWVHSGAGVKTPVVEIAQLVEQININRAREDQLLFCVDGVHGTGIENVNLSDLGCDFFYAGTHKWMFGPRGTGIIWARPEMHEELVVAIPSMYGSKTFGMRMTPGGFTSYEHRFAAKEAFEFHLAIGKEKIQNRIHDLNRRLKEGLLKIPGVTLYTPMDSDLSAGFVSFMIADKTPSDIIAAYAARKIIISSTTYDRVYMRMSAGLLNRDQDIDQAILATEEIAKGG